MSTALYLWIWGTAALAALWVGDVIVRRWRVPRLRNRRRQLRVRGPHSAIVPDERSSIELFRRMHGRR